ncbi:glycosyltransferase family 4 protein [Stutzerimonas xanthomarina]|uniref:glycosyltransferase family 4 protein n=1 Tax=Stutzerimonas xanthomarina TaxID=271420 RepID=UPI003AA9A0ED
MRVLLVGPSLSQRGGVVSVIQGLIVALSSNGVQVDVLPTTAPKSGWVNFYTFIRSWVVLLVICLLRRVDIVHIHMASRGSCLRKSVLGLTCWVFRTPFVIHLHGAEFRFFYSCELGLIRRKLVVFTFSRAARVIALSEIWKQWLETEMNVKHVSVVFNGVSHFLESSEISQKKRPTVLFLGRLGTRKGTDELIASMREVTRQVPNVVLELGGDGDIERYRKQAADLPNVRFLGWVDDAGRRAALARATVYCLPSWNEGLPMSVLEAMSAGLPVVSTSVGGIPEAVESGVNGLLLPPGNVQMLASALSQLLLDHEMAKSMGVSGKARHHEQFSVEAMGRNCLEIYAACANQQMALFE